MIASDRPNFSDGSTAAQNARRVLLIGDVAAAFTDSDFPSDLSCQFQPNMLDAINAASRTKFDTIAVVMSNFSSQLASGLKALRKVNRNAKIILLAKMYEEPKAIQLMRSASNGSAIANDYLICPVETDNFCRVVMPSSVAQRISDAHIVKEESQYAIRNTQSEKIAHLEKLATEDGLTGLKNRRYIWEFANQTIELARSNNSEVTLMIFDIDNFKHYNDEYGHPAGDEILKQVAVLMERCCRGHDIIGRIGGDEFAVIFWDNRSGGSSDTDNERRLALADHPKEAVFIAKRFRKELEKTELPLLGTEGKGVLSISGGLASFPGDGSTIDEVFCQADNALLEAKRGGKNRIYLVGRRQGDIENID